MEVRILFSSLNFSYFFISLDIQWLKNHVDIVEDFSNFLIQVKLLNLFINSLKIFLIKVIKKLPHVVHHCPNEALVLLFQFGKLIPFIIEIHIYLIYFQVKNGLQLHEQTTLRSITMFTVS